VCRCYRAPPPPSISNRVGEWQERFSKDWPVAHDLIFVFTGYFRYIQPIYVIKPGARGDIKPPKDATSTERIAWTMPKGAPYLNTPLVYAEYLYVLGNSGVLACYRARTGEKIYQQRLGKGGYFTASAVAGGGKLYFTN
jgi:outer membrane protein assembly factor BamB